MEENYYVCDECGAKIDIDDAINIDGIILCRHCADEITIECRHCGDRIWRSNSFRDTLCYNCYERYYTVCSDCNRLINLDDAYYLDDDEFDHEYPYCEDCYDSHNSERIINDYYYKPDPVFFGNDSNLYMGVELEVDEGGEEEDYAERVLEIANKKESLMYIKHDGSLNEGFELVTHPMTLNYHRKNVNWKEILSTLIHYGYRSHNAHTCGLHIHINRNALGCTFEKQEEVTGRLIYFYEKFWPEILRFSRRTEDQANHWASRYGGVISDCKNVLKTAKKSGLGRYTAVNLTNPNTIEFRIFRGTLLLNTLIATFEFTHYLCDLAINTNDEEFQKITWKDFVKSIDSDKYPELINYLKIRRLFINETKEEV